MEKRLIKSETLSKLIDTPIFTIRKLAREKKIRAYKIGRDYRFDLEEVIEDIKKCVA